MSRETVVTLGFAICIYIFWYNPIHINLTDIQLKIWLLWWANIALVFHGPKAIFSGPGEVTNAVVSIMVHLMVSNNKKLQCTLYSSLINRLNDTKTEFGCGLSTMLLIVRWLPALLFAGYPIFASLVYTCSFHIPLLSAQNSLVSGIPLLLLPKRNLEQMTPWS